MLLTLALLGCSGKDDADDTGATAGLPPDFQWGAAIAGFQVDPGCPTLPAEECEDRASDWYQWVTDPELIADGSTFLSGEPLSDGPGHHELYAQDLQLAQDLGLNALRTSIEWSRLFPDGAAEQAENVTELAQYVDDEAVAWYHTYFQSMRVVGLEPLVTLNHYTLPLWLHDGKACHQDFETCEDRGWADRDRTLRAIALYSEFCAGEFGGDVDNWATINEPLAIVLAGYLLPGADRTNPPGIANPAAAFDVFYALAEGNAVMYDAVKAHDGVDADGDGAASFVGIVPNLAAIAPTDPDNPDDLRGAEDANYVYNEMWLNAAVNGDFDRDVDGVAEEHHDEVAGRVDFIGVNYYTRITVRGLDGPLIGGLPKSAFYPDILWEEYPEGITEVLRLADRYGFPTIITENGTQPTDESGEVFLRPHIAGLEAAAAEGIDIRGYYYWTLMDNYEWNHGMSYKFGLYEVDIATKARTLRPMGEDYAAIVAANGTGG